jgi:hypothetical protein
MSVSGGNRRTDTIQRFFQSPDESFDAVPLYLKQIPLIIASTDDRLKILPGIRTAKSRKQARCRLAENHT